MNDISKAANDLINLARQVKTSREMTAKLNAAADTLKVMLAAWPLEATRTIRADELRPGDTVKVPGRVKTIRAIAPRWDGGKVSIQFDGSPVGYFFNSDETLVIVSREGDQP